MSEEAASDAEDGGPGAGQPPLHRQHRRLVEPTLWRPEALPAEVQYNNCRKCYTVNAMGPVPGHDFYHQALGDEGPIGDKGARDAAVKFATDVRDMERLSKLTFEELKGL